MDMAQKRYTVGIDVGKYELVAATPSSKKPRSVKNAPEAIGAWLDRLKVEANAANAQLWLACEATGIYHRQLHRCAAERGIPLSVIPPKWIYHEARSWGKESKTDRLDAGIIQRYAESRLPTATPFDALLFQLQEEVSARAHLVRVRAGLLTHLQLFEEAISAACYKQSIADIGKQITTLEQEINSIVDEIGLDNVCVDAIRKEWGVGPVLLSIIFAFLPEIGTMGRRAISNLAGVAPCAKDSGMSHGKRHIRGGREVVRTALYSASVCLLRGNSRYRQRYDRLRERGKAHRVALLAVAHDFLIHLNSVAKRALAAKQAAEAEAKASPTVDQAEVEVKAIPSVETTPSPASSSTNNCPATTPVTMPTNGTTQPSSPSTPIPEPSSAPSLTPSSNFFSTKGGI